MIGVIADPADHEVAREFFELFKTPWEFYRPERVYDVVLCNGGMREGLAAALVVEYVCDGRANGDQSLSFVLHSSDRIAVYGGVEAFPKAAGSFLFEEQSNEAVGYKESTGSGTQARIGYDLFAEVRTLLTDGQPAANAMEAALELHIGVLRSLILGCGITLVEIPPVPEGHPFIACLTHDVDHPSLRRHELDHTALGFVMRATVGSLAALFRGRIKLHSLFKNWLATAKLPFVYLGLAKDFWLEFADHYLELEKGACSTFFVIPFASRPGRKHDGPAPRIRASRYGAADISTVVKKLADGGDEIALHGIDAWLDSDSGREELQVIRNLTGEQEIGVRMHWLYFDAQSPAVLEKAGATFDSTVGYNQTVGYRAGTTQAFKPLQAERLLELPLHAMDTAMFYPSYMGLSAGQAKELLSRLVSNAKRFGGCLTVNWHDRSLAPERQWGEAYCGVLQEMKDGGAWFATASQAVGWFRKRRAVTFEAEHRDGGVVRANVQQRDNLPGLRLRVHHPGKPYSDTVFHENADTQILSEVTR